MLEIDCAVARIRTNLQSALLRQPIESELLRFGWQSAIIL